MSPGPVDAHGPAALREDLNGRVGQAVAVASALLEAHGEPRAAAAEGRAHELGALVQRLEGVLERLHADVDLALQLGQRGDLGLLVVGDGLSVGRAMLLGDMAALREGKKFGVGPREGPAVGVVASSSAESAPDQRNPSKRPLMRISHSGGLMSQIVESRSCMCGYLTR
ncbi:hypothetical protein VP1G_08465 [Cytospora mali]|uniref:Uncharacterized protein n=1 Tax=Cytospora mali TaxID=578113 RepID=A0A194VBD5_CYTMA|nr:hypothetical protein VP1G_08465 [Valsa mali var. pyri (nom. inval.)]